jgi:hypothetical protein
VWEEINSNFVLLNSSFFLITMVQKSVRLGTLKRWAVAFRFAFGLSVRLSEIGNLVVFCSRISSMRVLHVLLRFLLDALMLY